MHSEDEQLRGQVLEARVLGADYWGKAEVRLLGSGSAEMAPKGVATIVGKLLQVKPGDTVEAFGQWVSHARYGWQFKARRIDRALASEVSGVVAWIEARLPQLGRNRATALVERFGVPGIWEVLEGDGQELLEVGGITPARQRAILEAYAEHRVERDRMVRLRGWGLSDHQIAVLQSEWGERADEAIAADPYWLLDHVPGFGFRRADAVASRMGVAADAPPRIAAGVTHFLRSAAEAGHIYVPRSKAVNVIAGVKILGGVELRKVDDQIDRMVRHGRVVFERGRIALPELWQAEMRAAARLLYALAGAGRAA